jgi:murein DD-endopeptidase MepM/ murein hydrolase activator NlpD
MYAQLQSMTVAPGDFVKAGGVIGTVGNAGGIYQAHLHWEVRDTVGLGLGLGFSQNRDGWMNPGDFLAAHRGDRAGKPLLPKLLAPNERAGWGTEF